MWLVELMLISLVLGTILGVCWRLFDDWREKQEVKAIDYAQQEMVSAKSTRLVGYTPDTRLVNDREDFIKHGDNMPITKVYSDKN